MAFIFDDSRLCMVSPSLNWSNSHEYCKSECAYDSSSDSDISSDHGDTEPNPKKTRTDDGYSDSIVKVPRLFDLAARVVATKIPFEAVEHYHQRTKKLSESVVLAILKKAFPSDRDMVGVQASLSRSSFDADSFRRESDDCRIVVKDATQTGLSLTGTLIHEYLCRGKRKTRKAVVSVLFDRQCITSATCSVHRRRVLWCKHVVRLVNHRISKPESVVYRLPISFTLERLNLTQMKHFLGSLLAGSSSKLLHSASRAIDTIHTEAVAKSFSCKRSDVSVLAPDLTARKNKSDSFQWQFDEKRVRRAMKMYVCYDGIEFLRGGRSLTAYASNLMFCHEWCSLLLENQERSLTKIERDADGGLTWPGSDNLDSLFSVVEHLLKSGDGTVLKVLEVLTEQWLGVIEKVLRVVRRQVPSDGQTREDEIESNDIFYPNNKDLLLASGRAWFVPDRLICCWRLAVLNPFYSSEEIERLRARHIEWAIRVRRILTETSRLRNIIDEDDEVWLELCTLLSLANWNGFCHVEALASPISQRLIKIMANPDTNTGSDGAMVEDRTDFLRTLSCFVQCLQFYGYGAEAASVTVKGIISTLRVCVEVPCLSSLATLSMSSVKRCHDEVGQHLWGSPDHENDGDDSPEDPIPLASLLHAIINDSSAWEINCRVPVTQASTGSESDQDGMSPVSPERFVPLPVYVLLECFQKIAVDFQCKNASQLDVFVELNKLLGSLVDRLRSLSQQIKTNVYQAVCSRTEEAFDKPVSPIKLSFLLRLLMSDLGDTESVLSLLLVGKCLKVLASDLSGRLGGNGLNEDFFLAVTNYSSLIVQSLCFCLRLGHPMNDIYSLILQAMDFDCYQSHYTYVTSRRLHQFTDDLLQIVAIVCPAVSDHIDISGPLPFLLPHRLAMLHLPSICSCCDKTNDVLIACKLLTRLLEISRYVQNDVEVSERRARALRSISELAAVAGGETVVRIVAGDDWYRVMSATEAIRNFLLEPTFVTSFKSRKEHDLCPAVEKVMREVILDSLYSCPFDDLISQASYYGAIKKLGLVPLVIRDVLADIPDTCRLAHRILFRLSESLWMRPSEAFPVALKAYRTMWSHGVGQGDCLVTSRTPASDSTVLRGAHCLGAMAMHLDVVATPPGTVTKMFSNTERTLLVVMEMWVDPIISLHVVAEMARIHSEGKFPPESFPESDILQACDWLFSQPSWALASLSRVCSSVTSVLIRCKSSIIAKLMEDVHLTWLPSIVRPGSQLIDKPKRRLLGDDFLCLATILDVLPDSAVDMQALLSHSATCIWQEAARNYSMACRQRPNVSLFLNCYERYYNVLICDNTWKKRLPSEDSENAIWLT